MKTPFDPQAEITPVILAGGEGRRLRPLTSPDRPKPFLKLFGGRSLLQATALRCAGFGPPVVVCAKRYGGRALQDFDDIHVKPKRIVLEPVARSTAPALALAALGLDADAFMLVCPSDHVIGDSDAFIRGERAAGRAAGGDHIAFLAVRPDRAATRYGYIRCKPAKNGVHDVLCFTEKPDVRRAKVMIKDPNVFWNTGIFVVRVGAFLDLLARHAPDIMAAAQAAYDKGVHSGVFFEADFTAYSAAPHDAIDTALMEKLAGAKLIRFDSFWRDVGCWPSLIHTIIQTKCRHLFVKHV